MQHQKCAMAMPPSIDRWGLVAREAFERRLSTAARCRSSSRSACATTLLPRGRRERKPRRDERFLRALHAHGFVSSAVDKEKALVDLAPHTRHKSLLTLQGYVRNRDQWKRSPLFGVGF